MKNLVRAGVKSLLAVAVLWGLTALLGATSAWGVEKHEYRSAGIFVEGCSCSVPCTCTMTGPKHGCQSVGAMTITSGTYKGVDLAGAKIAYATTPGSWIRFYVEAKDQRQQDAATEFAKAVYYHFGKAESAQKATIDISGKDGNYTLTVDEGKIMQLTTEPVLGADKKTPLAHHNTFQPLSPTVMQGKTVKGSFHDGERAFELEGSNSFFNSNMHSSGKI